MGQRVHCRKPAAAEPRTQSRPIRERCSRPLALASGAWPCPYDPGPLAITLNITMPDAWANINAAACLPTVCDPICGTCDIRATVRAATDEYRACACHKTCAWIFEHRAHARNSIRGAAAFASPVLRLL